MVQVPIFIHQIAEMFFFLLLEAYLQQLSQEPFDLLAIFATIRSSPEMVSAELSGMYHLGGTVLGF